MGQIEFVNDLCCNYLTIPYRGEEYGFALRMMTENVTDAFLTAQLRRLDGQTFLYYKISGMQSMEVLYAERPVDRSVFQTFMWQLHEAIEQSRELFLPGDGICLEPPDIFWDFGEKRWKFIYIPDQKEREAGEVQTEREKLAEFLVMHIDYEDKELTEAVYRFYEEVCEGKAGPGFWERKIMPEKTRETEREEKTETAAEAETEDWDFEEPEGEEEKEELKERSAHGNGKIRILLCVLLCAAAAAALAMGRVTPDVMPAGAGIVVLLAVFLSAILIKRRDRDKNKPEDIICIESGEDLYRMEDGKGEEYGEAEHAAEEKTVYMDIRKEQKRKLYGIGKFKQQRILLDELPCLVGKDKTLVNHIIADTSVSRMHAKFWAKEEEIWMQDLNSTNGTYHNGMRLNPNERVKLEVEDEIGFGQAQFVFR